MQIENLQQEGFQADNYQIRVTNHSNPQPSQQQQIKNDFVRVQQNQKAIKREPVKIKKNIFNFPVKKKNKSSYQRYNHSVIINNQLKKRTSLLKSENTNNKSFTSFCRSQNYDVKQGIPIVRQDQIQVLDNIVYIGFRPSNSWQYYNRKYSEQKSINSSQLSFDSQFQSGNLDLVTKKNDIYHLYIRPDTNTRGHKQWFFFSIKANSSKKYRINIHSFKKKSSLFQKGMRPYGKKKKQSKTMWEPIGQNIKYIEQQNIEHQGQLKKQYYLSFDLWLDQGEQMLIASSIPYTYSYLLQRIEQMKEDQSQLYFKSSILCKSVSGLNVPIITINERAQSRRKPKFIIINARMHPGQSSSSWIIDGILSQLNKSAKIKQTIISSNIVIKIIPMLNAEGVYMGNYRTGILGVDYNRLFLTGQEQLFPQVISLKQLIKRCKLIGQIELYIDMHGHSIHPGIFVFGPEPTFKKDSPHRQIIKQLKKLKYFEEKYCNSTFNSSKIETSRVFFQVKQNIFSITCQCSLGLYNNNFSFEKRLKLTQFQASNWQQFGKDFIKSIIKQYQKPKYDVVLLKMQQKRQKTRKSKESQFIWQRFNTQKYERNLQRQIGLINEMQQAQIEQNNLVSNKILPLYIDQIESSQNDSDSQSDNLSSDKQKLLFKIVSDQIKAKNKRSVTFYHRNTSKDAKDKKSSQSKYQSIVSVKQYRFGYEPAIFQYPNDIPNLSTPKYLKAEHKIQSFYFSKRSTSKMNENNELNLKSIKFFKKKKHDAKQSILRLKNQQKTNQQQLEVDFSQYGKYHFSNTLNKRK